MAGNRNKFDNTQLSGMSFWKSADTSSSSSSSSSHSSSQMSKEDDMLEEDLSAVFTKFSIREIVNATLTDANSNFNDLCNGMNSMDIHSYRNKTLTEADVVSDRVEKDLERVNRIHGVSKSAAEEEKRLGIVQAIQAYTRCLELDIRKWKYRLKELGKSDSDIEKIQKNIKIPTFINWDQRKSSAPAYSEDKLEKPATGGVFDQIAFVQLALNYWRSSYHHIREYEKLIGAVKYEEEMKLWSLEQTSLAYLNASGNEYRRDINAGRMREPSSINPITGEPLSIAAVQQLIKQKQERSEYQLTL